MADGPQRLALHRFQIVLIHTFTFLVRIFTQGLCEHGKLVHPLWGDFLKLGANRLTRRRLTWWRAVAQFGGVARVSGALKSRFHALF
eukprot:scaffold5138_cov251-Pinguiococcus_pyrenoidosus.AAC.18